MTGPKVCKTRWSATKTSPTIAHGVFFLYYICVKRGGFWSERGQTTTRSNTLRKSKQLWSAAHMYILENAGGHIILHSAVFGNQSSIFFFGPVGYDHTLSMNKNSTLHVGISSKEVQALKFDVAMNSNFQCLLFIQPIGCNFPVWTSPGFWWWAFPASTRRHTLDHWFEWCIFPWESQAKGMNGFRESHPRCKQNRHSNEPGILNPCHSVKCLQPFTIPSKQQRNRTSKCFHLGNPRIAMFCDYHLCFQYHLRSNSNTLIRIKAYWYI